MFLKNAGTSKSNSSSLSSCAGAAGVSDTIETGSEGAAGVSVLPNGVAVAGSSVTDGVESMLLPKRDSGRENSDESDTVSECGSSDTRGENDDAASEVVSDAGDVVSVTDSDTGDSIEAPNDVAVNGVDS